MIETLLIAISIFIVYVVFTIASVQNKNLDDDSDEISTSGNFRKVEHKEVILNQNPESNREKSNRNEIIIVSIIILFAITRILLNSPDSPEELAEKQAVASKKWMERKEREEWLEKSRVAEAQIAANRLEGANLLEQFDSGIRKNVDERRAALESAAVEHRRLNTNGSIMTDGYTMKDGRFIICTTKVLSSGPAIMECDGEQ